MADISDLDQRMLRMAAYKSPAEISEAMGGTVSPAEVASRVQELLSDRDWLSIMQRKQMLLFKLEEIIDRYWTWAMDGSVKSFQHVVLPAIQEIRKLLSEDKESLEDFMMRITDTHAERMGMGFAIGFAKIIEMMKAEPDRDPDEMVLEVVPLALRQVDADVGELQDAPV